MNVSAATQESVDKLVDDLRTVVHDAQDLLKAGAGDLTEKGKEARARLEEALQRARETCEQYEGRASQAARAATETIRDHPLPSMGVAFGIGVLIGVLINRR